MSLYRDTVAVCRMIKIEHSVFALPFAFTGAFLAQGAGPGWTLPSWRLMAPLTVAMVAVRSFAMAYNRLADLDIDRLNPRTQGRPLVTGELSVDFTKRFLFFCALIFTTACAALNATCLMLSPVAGWLAVSPSHLGYPAVLLFCGVTLWVAGFDILYACQDAEFDRSQGLHSLPAVQGVPRALFTAAVTHACTALLFPMVGLAAGQGIVALAVSVMVGGVLVWEHKLISADNLSRINVAFFTLNGVISAVVFLGAWADLVLGSPWMVSL